MKMATTDKDRNNTYYVFILVFTSVVVVGMVVLIAMRNQPGFKNVREFVWREGNWMVKIYGLTNVFAIFVALFFSILGLANA